MKIAILVLASMFIVGCGRIDRFVSGITGEASQVCMNGVLYYQFTSGASVAYDTNGKVMTCK